MRTKHRVGFAVLALIIFGAVMFGIGHNVGIETVYDKDIVIVVTNQGDNYTTLLIRSKLSPEYPEWMFVEVVDGRAYINGQGGYQALQFSNGMVIEFK